MGFTKRLSKCLLSPINSENIFPNNKYVINIQQQDNKVIIKELSNTNTTIKSSPFVILIAHK